MANAYGTKEYKRLIEEYLSDLTFKKAKEENFIFGNLKTKIEFFECDFTEDGCCCHAEKNVMTITDREGKNHIYECIDAFMPPYEFEYKGEAYLIFRKALYGYTILNLNDFSERNYFPSDVLEEKEAFILCEAKIFGDFLILYGCFWAGPYLCYALDFETLDIINLSVLFGIEDVADHGISIPGDVLVLTDENTDKTYSVCQKELKKLLVASKNKDL